MALTNRPTLVSASVIACAAAALLLTPATAHTQTVFRGSDQSFGQPGWWTPTSRLEAEAAFGMEVRASMRVYDANWAEQVAGQPQGTLVLNWMNAAGEPVPHNFRYQASDPSGASIDGQMVGRTWNASLEAGWLPSPYPETTSLIAMSPGTVSFRFSQSVNAWGANFVTGTLTASDWSGHQLEVYSGGQLRYTVARYAMQPPSPTLPGTWSHFAFIGVIDEQGFDELRWTTTPTTSGVRIYNPTIGTLSTVPEPSTYVMLGGGLLVVARVARRRRS